MMDQRREKRSHQSTFVKQLCYYTIVVTLQIRSAQHQVFLKRFLMYSFSLTVLTNAGKTITMIDTEGYSHDITSAAVIATLGIGWAAFGLSILQR